MSRRRLAAVANFHRERRVAAKTARFLGASQRRLAARGIDFLIEFVLDRPDAETVEWIGRAADAIPDSRLHRLEHGDLGAARAHGVRSARAEVVCFVDGDDFFSMNWFESALDALSGGPRREIVHTQFLVAYGEERFIRETVDSRDRSFDPLSLAVDWYWNGNLALQRSLFDEVPIEPYDHAAGFGSEDWHWSCNTTAAGIARVVIPDTCYYYRIKPAKLALGRIGEVIHKQSRLYDTARLPPPPTFPSAERPTVSALTPRFFEQAREIESFELGVSWLRALEAGALSVKRFKPHTPPLIGRILRGAWASGFGDGSLVVFVDEDRLPGGLEAASRLASALSGDENPEPARRLYIVEGDRACCAPVADGYAVAVRELREAGLNLPRRQRLVARFLIQSHGLTVLNLLSPRHRSLGLGYARATRASVARWVNVVTEYGSDGLSQVWEEIEAFRSGEIDAETVAIFEKTAREAAEVRGLRLAHDPDLEAVWVGDASKGRAAPRPAAILASAGEPDWVRLALADGDPRLTFEEVSRLRNRARSQGGCLIVLGKARPGWTIRQWDTAADWAGGGLRIPAVTVIGQGDQPPFNLVHPVERLNQRLAAGHLPAELLLAGVIGMEASAVSATIGQGAMDLGALLRGGVASARSAGVPPLALLAPGSLCFIGKGELRALDVARLARRLGASVEEPEA